MKGRGRMEAELGGHGTFVFAIGNAMLDVNAAAEGDDAHRYHRVVKNFLLLTACETGYMGEVWRQWEGKNLVDVNGQPLQEAADLTREHRGLQYAHAIAVLRKKGILGKLSHTITDATDWLTEVMDEQEDDDETEALRPAP